MSYRHTPARHPEPCPWVAQLTPEEREGLGGSAGSSWVADRCMSWGDGCARGCYRKREVEKVARREALEARGGGPRAFPYPKGKHRSQRGWCSWCDGKIETTNAGRRGWHDGREGEPDCLFELKLHTDREVQVNFLLGRDGPGCCDCGELKGRWSHGGMPTDPDKLRSWGEKWARWYPADVYVGELEIIDWSTSLELEHDIPLWLVEHLPPWERRRYFGPSNLKLRCRPCHLRKSAWEAAERAKGNRLRDPKPSRGRKMQSRGFPKGHRPLRGS